MVITENNMKDQKMIKRITSILLILVFAVSLLSSCADKDFYPEIESTEEEKRVVFKFNVGEEVYEVRYELYRTLFLTYKKEVDGGDNSVWTSANAKQYIDRIDRMIIDAAANIFTVLHLAKEAGFDPYSDEVNTTIREYVKRSVDGYEDDGVSIKGFNGDYNAYLDSLKAVYMNYSVQTLIYRYAIAYDKLLLHYYGNVSEDNPNEQTQGAIKYTDETLRDYYYGNDSVRVILATINSKYISEERAQEIRYNIASYSTETSVINYIISATSTTAADAQIGLLIGKYAMDSTLFSNTLATAAFNLSYHETSPVINYDVNGETYYYIFYRTDKSDTYFENNKDAIIASYMGNEIGRMLSEGKSEVESRVVREALMSELDRSSIAMP